MTTVALLGNPNVGKTTLFNELTGSKQYVGNWPGVTVDKKEGFFEDIKIVDLPGIYAMDTYSNEEKVSKSFLQEDEVDLILNIVDASNLERNLYLTTQLKEFNKPIVLALNMVDVLEARGIEIHYKKLEEMFNVTIVPISAAKKLGLDELKDVLKNKKFNGVNDAEKFKFDSEKEAYRFIDNILDKCLKKKDDAKEALSEKVDRILLNPFLAYPIFILMMILTFKITFSWVGQPLSDILDGLLNDSFMPWVSELLSNSSPWFQSLIVDGIISGVGGILVLLPVILSLFICITILEDSGYMARVAFLMDKLMRRMGLSGKAFIPMMVGFGCSVPAIMTARTLESEKDRKLTALLIPLLFKNTLFKKDEEPFIIELPEYKVPQVKSVINQTLDKAKGFIKKAGTIIFAMSVLIWFLSNFSLTGMVEEVNDSILASIGNFIAPIFAPLGFGNWQSAVSLLSGLLAKESVLASMEVIFSGDLNVILPMHFTAVSSYAFLVFILLYTPCISVIGTMKKEYGTKMTLFSVGYQLVLAWVVSFLVYNIGSLIF